MNSIEGYITCPFNTSHRILKARFQTHLSKCRKNYPKSMKVVCVFDATHMLNPEEYEDHLSKCPTSGNVKCSQIILEPQQQLGTISLEEACNVQTNIINEDWSGNNPTYDPLVTSENKNVIRGPIGMSKSKRKQFKQRERDRISALENNEDISYDDSYKTNILEMKTKFDQPLRAPKEVAKAVSYNKNFTDDLMSKLRTISIEENNNSSKKENISITNNNSFKTADSQKINSQNSTINGSNISLVSKNISIKVESDNFPDEENDVVEFQNVVEDKQNIAEIKDDFKPNGHVSQGNNSKTKENYEEINIRKDNLEQSLKTAKFYREAKKISTGRGFTIACHYMNSNIPKPGKENKNSENLGSAYDDDEE